MRGNEIFSKHFLRTFSHLASMAGIKGDNFLAIRTSGHQAAQEHSERKRMAASGDSEDAREVSDATELQWPV